MSYPVVGEVPWLVAQDNQLFGHPPTSPGEAAPPSLARRLASLGPSASINVGSSERYARFAQLVEQRASSGRRPLVLVVGGGIAGQGMEPLLRADVELVETDVYVGPRTAVVCDAHSLPFADDTFDGVVCQAVLEHVLDPWRVASEIQRVLRPEGLVYAETPFMQQVHEGAYDFTRFTHLGHRRLFRWFDEIESGAVAGPATSLLWSVRYFAMSLAGSSRVVRVLLDRLVTTCMFWIKYLDKRLVNTPGGLDAASATHFLGALRTSPVPDDEILDGYRGAMRKRVRRSG